MSGLHVARQAAAALAGKQGGQQQQEGAAGEESLAAKLQAATLDRFLSDEHPPIRRVKMVGLKTAG